MLTTTTGNDVDDGPGYQLFVWAYLICGVISFFIGIVFLVLTCMKVEERVMTDREVRVFHAVNSPYA